MSIIIPGITSVLKTTTTKPAVVTTKATTIATFAATAKVIATTTSSSTVKVTTITITTSSSLVKPTTTTSTTSSRITTTSSKPTTTTTTTSSTSSTTSTIPHITTSSTTSTHVSSTSSSSASASSTSVGLNGANAGSKISSNNRLSTGAIIGIVVGAIILLLIIAIISTRVIRKKRRDSRRRRSGIQAWTDQRSTLHGNDDDFFDPTAGVRAAAAAAVSGTSGAGVASSGAGEKPWGMEMTPSREKLDNYPSPNIYDREGQDITSAHSVQPFYPESQPQAYQPTPDPYAGQWTAYPQPIATPYGLAAPAQQHEYAQVSRSPSPGVINSQYMQGMPTIVAHLPEQVDQQQPQNAALASGVTLEHDPKLKDDMWVIARSSFVRSLEDELAIQPNDRLYLVQAYDDGWCLCEDANRQRGFVPLYCLQPVGALQPALALQPPSPAPHSPVSPGIVGEGQMETLTYSQPIVLVNGQAQQRGSGAKPSAGGNTLPRSDTSNSLGAKSERSQRRSSLFVDANTAGMYLKHQNVMGL